MKFSTLIKITLFSLCMYQAQAAAAIEAFTASSTTFTVLKVDQQIADWDAIFSAYRGQDLATVHMPELMTKVDQAVAYAKPVITDARALPILGRYVEEVTSAHAAGTLAFPLYARFIMGLGFLMNLKQGGEEDYSGFSRHSLEAVQSPLSSEAWLGDRPHGDTIRFEQAILQMLNSGIDPCIVLCRGGHFGYVRIVRGALKPEAPCHLIGIPLSAAMAHGAIYPITDFIVHDAEHGTDFLETFAAFRPLLDKLFGPIIAGVPEDPKTHDKKHREDVAGLYFLLHESSGISEQMHRVVQNNLGSPLKALGQGILEVAKTYFVNVFLDRFLGLWSQIFIGGDEDRFDLKVLDNLVVTKEKIEFNGNIVCRPYNPDGSALSVVLESNRFTIHLPEAMDGAYRIEVEQKITHMDALQETHEPEVAACYAKALEKFYAGATLLKEEKGVKTYQIKLIPRTSDHCFNVLENTFKGPLWDEFGTSKWVETGHYAEPSYTWDSAIAVREFFDSLFTSLQARWGAIWDGLPALDPALVASIQAALREYFGETVPGAGAAAAAGGAGASAT